MSNSLYGRNHPSLQKLALGCTGDRLPDGAHCGHVRRIPRAIYAKAAGTSCISPLTRRCRLAKASLTDLVRDQLAPSAEPGSERITVSGPDDHAKTRGRGSNWTGAARTGDQRGEIWRVISSGRPCYDFWAFEDHGTEPRQLLVSWAERGGPPVTPPSRTGFGHIVFERLVTKSLNGKVALDFAPEGLSWKLSIPTTNIVTEPVIARSWSGIRALDG